MKLEEFHKDKINFEYCYLHQKLTYKLVSLVSYCPQVPTLNHQLQPKIDPTTTKPGLPEINNQIS
jgi:hypothetical protein